MQSSENKPYSQNEIKAITRNLQNPSFTYKPKPYVDKRHHNLQNYDEYLQIRTIETEKKRQLKEALQEQMRSKSVSKQAERKNLRNFYDETSIIKNGTDPRNVYHLDLPNYGSQVDQSMNSNKSSKNEIYKFFKNTLQTDQMKNLHNQYQTAINFKSSLKTLQQFDHSKDMEQNPLYSMLKRHETQDKTEVQEKVFKAFEQINKNEKNYQRNMSLDNSYRVMIKKQIPLTNEPQKSEIQLKKMRIKMSKQLVDRVSEPQSFIKQFQL
ncbi:UNKNOWN [Stylonychia lemnae]|uniref:Uncharacterized protein n=1 Tax=Stylonychia lemnae TaxID=5949 RepID=A0A078AVU6_STYLE|nr:UNKNOWN [Stylonychia lemnae]|eukprot:CDW86550.1 UNKNOWN [Stylonychia lemnae]